MFRLNCALGMVAAAAFIVPTWALKSMLAHSEISAQVQTTQLRSSDFTMMNTTGFGAGEEFYQMYYAKMEPPVPVDHEDFFVNTISAVFSLGLKEYDAAAMERPKVISMPDSEAIVIIIGGGPEAEQDMPRERMLRIMHYFLPKVALEIGFFTMVCDLTLKDSPDVIAHIEVRTRAPEEIQPEQLNSEQFEVLTPPYSSGSTLNVGMTARRRSIQRRQSSQLGGDLPRILSTYSENVDLGITSFYLGMSTPVLTLSYKPKSTFIEEVDLTQRHFGIKGVIRGFKPPRTTRFMTVREVLQSLMLLTMEQLNRSRQQRKYYNAVTSQIFAPEDRSKQIGVMTVQQSWGAGDGEITRE